MKRHEYATAGIPHYWIVQPDRSVSIMDLGPDSYVERSSRAARRLTVDLPFPMEIDLATLSERRGTGPTQR
ncbi:MAG: Uma2 family endonuclease [Gordonia sp. (in: high G+C Gram-positive bacteria)]